MRTYFDFRHVDDEELQLLKLVINSVDPGDNLTIEYHSGSGYELDDGSTDDTEWHIFDDQVDAFDYSLIHACKEFLEKKYGNTSPA